MNVSAIKAVIFDCDGVLFDSKEANRAYYNALLQALGQPPLNPEQLEFAHCHTVFEVIDFLFPDPQKKKQAYELRKHIDYQQFLSYMKPEPYGREVLEQLKKRFYLGMATSRTNTIHRLLKQFDMHHYFQVIISAMDVKHPKPHPEALHKIGQTFGLRPSQMLYVGDAEVDAEMASRAKVPFVAYKNPRLSAQFKANGFKDLAQLLSLEV